MSELIRYFVRRIKRDEIAIEAGALAYTSVLALVPAITVVLSIFAMIPAFTPIKEAMMDFAAQNFMPVFTEAVGDSLTTFVAHATSMTVTGSLMLFVVSLMLIRSVDKTLNRIWHGGKRRITMTFAIYWTILTVGPLSFGIVVWATTKLIASNIFDTMELAAAVQTFYYLLPFFIETGMIFVLYTVMPVTEVKARDALVGAICVAIAFEALKRLFSAFILNFSDYEAIYGALAAAPVLMIWIYINWWLVLIGAEITAVLTQARSGTGEEVPKLIRSLVNLMSSERDEDSIIIAAAKGPAPDLLSDLSGPDDGHSSSIKVHISSSYDATKDESKA